MSQDSKTVKSVLHRADPFRHLHYCVFNRKVANILNILLKRHYILLIVDIPYGFRITRSIYDDKTFKYPQIEKMVKDFAELTLAPLWRIVIFHNMGQSLFVTTSLKSHCHVYFGMVGFHPYMSYWGLGVIKTLMNAFTLMFRLMDDFIVSLWKMKL